MKDSELRVWLYLQARAGKWFITYPTYEEIQAETGLSKGAVSKAVRGLEANARRSSGWAAQEAALQGPLLNQRPVGLFFDRNHHCCRYAIPRLEL